MCSPDLKVKAAKAMDILLSDDEKNDTDTDDRSRLKVMNYINGNNAYMKQQTLAEGDTRYVMRTPSDP
jgi:hypothetical protein